MGKGAIGAKFGHLITLSFQLLVSFAGFQLIFPLSVFAAQLKQIEQRGYLIVGVKENLRPLGFRNLDGQLVGLEIDLAQRLASELLNRQDGIRLKPVQNQDRFSDILADKVDLMIAQATATSSRARLVSFSIPYYLDGTALITEDRLIHSLVDLNHRTIAVLQGSSAISVIRYRLPQANLLGVESYEAAYAVLASGRASAFAADLTVLSGWVQEFPQYRLLPERLSTEPLCVVMPKGVQYDDLRRRVNAAIARWQIEGWLEQRALYWGLPGNRGAINRSAIQFLPDAAFTTNAVSRSGFHHR
ncbi:MAG: transporter substrate-binding domain-containing protein [Scytolyngbya sp. HA4215-MV1]|jgi:polar amino acid transport system substrate-binding protein|nr:transporter substrate-binding domain-containing protein [Scytolyngbya sp. HA4215-MV1]